MRQGMVLWFVFAAAGAMALTVSEQTVDQFGASELEDPNAVVLAEPAYTVTVSRIGKVLKVAIETASREQAELLFGARYEHSPRLAIYKGDLLLASGQFAFG
jgi:hypothetical protein